MNPLIRTELNNYAMQVTAEMRTRLSGNGKIATGKLLRSIKAVVTEVAGNPSIKFTMNHYGYWVDKGSKPSSKNPSRKMVKSIRAWCKVKGIDELAAYPIARSILKHGQHPTNFFTISLRRRQKQLAAKITKIMLAEELKGK